MAAHGAQRPGLINGARSAAHTFAAYSGADPEMVWAALTDADRNGAVLYGLAAHSSWVPQDPIDFRRADGAQVLGQVLCARPHERLSYVMHAGPEDPPTYLTWLIRPTAHGCTIRLQIDEIDTVDSVEDAEDIWLPALAALQRLVDPS